MHANRSLTTPTPCIAVLGKLPQIVKLPTACKQEGMARCGAQQFAQSVAQSVPPSSRVSRSDTWGPIATGRLAGAGHVDRANRVCLACNSGAIGDEKHMLFECTALAPLRQQHADLFTPRTDTMQSFFAQQVLDHLGVFDYVIDCLNFMNI